MTRTLIVIVLMVLTGRVVAAEKLSSQQASELFRIGESQRQTLIEAVESKLTDAETELELAQRGKYFHNRPMPSGYYTEDALVDSFPNRQSEETAIASIQRRIVDLKSEASELRDYSKPVVPLLSGRWLPVGNVGRIAVPVQVMQIVADGKAVVGIKHEPNRTEYALLSAQQLQEKSQFDLLILDRPVRVGAMQELPGQYAGQSGVTLHEIVVEHVAGRRASPKLSKQDARPQPALQWVPRPAKPLITHERWGRR